MKQKIYSMNPFTERLVSKVTQYKLSFLVFIIITLLCVIFVLLFSEKKEQTISSIKERGFLNCGVEKNLTGFSVLNKNSNWAGFNVDICRAIAISIFGNPEQIQFISNPKNNRLFALQNKKIDLLIQNMTWTLGRDSFFDFAGVTLYDGLGFMISAALGISSTLELSGASICVQAETREELYLVNYFTVNKMEYELISAKNHHNKIKDYENGLCDAVIANQLELAAERASFTDSKKDVILPELISKNPLSIMINQNESLLKDIIQRTLFLLIEAEELNITSKNIDRLYKNLKNSPYAVYQFFETAQRLGQKNNMNPNWAYQIIRSIGNYGEIFEKHLGSNTSMGLDRGINALWTKGGLMYPMPFY